MKKLVFLLSFLGLVLSAHGQKIARSGNSYMAGGQTYYNSTEFRGYLKNTAPDLFAQYNQGYKLGMAGWGLFAFGVVAFPTGALWFRTQLGSVLGPVQMTLGGIALIEGITFLGIGYHKMHKAVDVYNLSQTTTAPQTYWSIRTSSNGIGIAYNF